MSNPSGTIHAHNITHLGKLCQRLSNQLLFMLKLCNALELRLLLFKVPRDQVVPVNTLAGLPFHFTQV